MLETGNRTVIGLDSGEITVMTDIGNKNINTNYMNQIMNND